MTGRDLIIYILQNNLEDEPIVQDGKLIGFMSTAEYALENNMGVASVMAKFKLGLIPGIVLGDRIYIYKGGKE